VTSHLLTGVRPYGEDPTDILITDTIITAIGPDAAAKAPADAVRHALNGLIALPGLVDIHTHLREPGGESAETVYTGTRAAAIGGYTAVFAIVTMTIGPFLGLVSALLLNRARAFQAFFRSAFFLPVTMSLVVVASMWKMILNDAGLLNKFLEFFGIPGHDWLADPSTSLMSVSMASIWQGFGFETVIFLAALQSIPREHYEAAAVDGAGPLRTFMAVTLPALRPTLLFVYVMGTIGAFQVFDQIYVMTQGGPTSSTTTLVYYIVERFHSFDLGKASAAAYLLAAFLAVASAIQMKIERRGA